MYKLYFEHNLITVAYLVKLSDDLSVCCTLGIQGQIGKSPYTQLIKISKILFGRTRRKNQLLYDTYIKLKIRFAPTEQVHLNKRKWIALTAKEVSLLFSPLVTPLSVSYCAVFYMLTNALAIFFLFACIVSPQSVF